VTFGTVKNVLEKSSNYVTLAHKYVTFWHTRVPITHKYETFWHKCVPFLHTCETPAHSSMTLTHKCVPFWHKCVPITHKYETFWHKCVPFLHTSETPAHSSMTLTHKCVPFWHKCVPITHKYETFWHKCVPFSHTRETPAHTCGVFCRGRPVCLPQTFLAAFGTVKKFARSTCPQKNIYPRSLARQNLSQDLPASTIKTHAAFPVNHRQGFFIKIGAFCSGIESLTFIAQS